MLCDTGPIVAALVVDDSEHKRCVEALKHVSMSTLITTLPCITEMMYFLGRAEGWRGQEKLWLMLERRVLVIHEARKLEVSRTRELMHQYWDTPMDFADASLVAAAEEFGAC